MVGSLITVGVFQWWKRVSRWSSVREVKIERMLQIEANLGVNVQTDAAEKMEGKNDRAREFEKLVDQRRSPKDRLRRFRWVFWVILIIWVIVIAIGIVQFCLWGLVIAIFGLPLL